MAPLGACFDLSILGFGQASDRARGRRAVTAASQTERRARADGWWRWSSFGTLGWLGDCCCHRVRRIRGRRRSVRFGHLRIAHRGTVESETIGIVHETIEDGVGECRLADDLVPGV